MKKVLVFLLSITASVMNASTTRVLFIGNSYTYVNNLPQQLYNLALTTGDTIIFDSSAPGGYTFQLHTTNATTLQKINAQPWDFAVLQEQSQIPSFPPSQVASDCLPYAQQLVSLIRQNDSCTTPLFYMTWGRKYGDASNCANYPPLCTYAGMSQRLRESYLQMCDENLAMSSPVGVAFYNSRMSDSTINLYQSDNSHPSVAGSYLAACTFYASIFHNSPIGLSYLGGLTQTTATFLQTIASHTVLDSLSAWRNGNFLANATFSHTINGNNVSFQPNDTYSNGQYHWDFGDGTSSSNSQVQHIFLPGSYIVSNTVTRFCSSDTVTQTITVGNPTSIKTNLNNSLSDEIVSVCDAMGNTLQHIQQLDQLSKGVYVVTFKNKNILYRKKIVLM
jgi:hypothetical protein